jgi:hypothetical protein
VTFKQLRRLCMSLPEVEERETWGDATFRVRGKIFVISSPDGDTASMKASLDDQSGLVAIDPETFSVAAYTGRYGWVRVQLGGVTPHLAEALITNAWKRTAPKRLVMKLGPPASRSIYDNLPARSPSAAPNTRLKAGKG